MLRRGLVAMFATGVNPGESFAAQAALLDSLAFLAYATGPGAAMADVRHSSLIVSPFSSGISSFKSTKSLRDVPALL